MCLCAQCVILVQVVTMWEVKFDFFVVSLKHQSKGGVAVTGDSSSPDIINTRESF